MIEEGVIYSLMIKVEHYLQKLSLFSIAIVNSTLPQSQIGVIHNMIKVYDIVIENRGGAHLQHCDSVSVIKPSEHILSQIPEKSLKISFST